MSEHADLMEFLAHCSQDALWAFDGNDLGIDVARSGDLATFGWFVHCFRECRQFLRGIDDLWHLADATREESFRALTVLAQLQPPEALRGFGFVLGDTKGEEVMRERAVFEIPICLNSPQRGLIANLRAAGEVLLSDGEMVGIELETTREVNLEVRSERFAKTTTWPELVLWPAHRTIVLSPKLSVAGSDPDGWGCELEASRA